MRGSKQHHLSTETAVVSATWSSKFLRKFQNTWEEDASTNITDIVVVETHELGRAKQRSACHDPESLRTFI